MSEDNSPQTNYVGTMEQQLYETLSAGLGLAPGSRVSAEKVNSILEALKDDSNEGRQLAGIDELCNYLSLGTESTVSAMKVDKLIPELVNLLKKNHNYDLMILSARALTHMMDCMPSSASYVVSHGAIPVIMDKFSNMEVIDVVEQCISVLHHISENYGSSLLKEGALMQCVMFMDFFSMSVQRKIVKIVANIFKRLSPSHFEYVMPVLEKMSELLGYDDSQIVEISCFSFSRLVSCFPHDVSKLETICTSHNIIDKLLNLMSNYTDVSRSTFVNIINTLTISARNSAVIAKALHQKKISNILGSILSGETTSSVIKTNNKSHSEQYFNEIVSLMNELLPHTPSDESFITEMSHSKRRLLFQQMATPEKYRSKPSASGSSYSSQYNQKKQIINQNPTFLLDFGITLIPILTRMYTSSHNTTTRYKCLTIIGTSIFYSSTEIVSEMLRDIPFSTFLASVLSSSDLVDVATGIQISELLLKKLPDIFKVYFVREGVIYQIVKFSGRKPNDPSPMMFDMMKERVKNAYEKAKISQQQSKEVEKTNDMSDEDDNDQEPQNDHVKHVEEEKKQKKGLFSRLEQVVKRKKNNASSSKVVFTSVPPIVNVEVPSIPVTSKLGKEREKEIFRNQELAAFVVAIAQQFHKKYFDEDLKSSKFTSPVVSTLKKLGDELLVHLTSPNIEEKHILVNIREVLVGEEGVSNFELLNSEIFKALLQYLTTKVEAYPTCRMKRAQIFCEVFDRELISNQAVNTSCSPGTSPFRSKVSASTRHTYFLELVRKLQACLSQTETFPLIVNEYQSGIFLGISGLLSMLSKPIKFEMKPFQKESSEKMTVSITPLDTVSTLVKFLQTRLKEKNDTEKNKKNQEHTSIEIDEETEEPSTAKIQNEDATDYFDVEEYGEEDEYTGNSQVSVVKVPKDNRKESEKYAFLKSVPNSSEGTSNVTNETKYELLYEGHVLDQEMNIFSTLYRYSKKNDSENRHPSSCKFWESVKTIQFREIQNKQSNEVTEDKENREQKRWFMFGKCDDISLEDAIALEKGLDSSILQNFPDLDAEATEALEFLRVLFLLSTNISKFTYFQKLQPGRKGEKNRLIDSREFRNAKLSSKLTRQLHDPYVLFTSCLPEWCHDLISICPFLFSFEVRQEFFDLTNKGIARAIKKMQDDQVNDHRRKHDRIVRIEKQKLQLARDKILEDAFYVMETYGSNRRIFEFEFAGEVGTGLGPTLEFYTLVSQELQHKELKIWREEQSKTTDPNDTPYVYAPSGLFPKPISPDKITVREERIFRFMGIFVARAMLDHRLVDLPFSNAFLKIIRGDQLTVRDLRSVDPNLFTQLQSMYKCCEQKKEIENSTQFTEQEKEKLLLEVKLEGKARIEDLCLDFTLPGYGIELVQNGSKKDVTLQNLEDYLELVVRFTLDTGIKRQIDAFRDGFNKVMSIKMLRMFNLKEMEDIICGCEEIWTEQLLIESTNCDHGYSHNCKAVKFLFTVLTELDKNEQKKFLKFVTGSPKLPVGGIRNLRPRLTIVRKPVEDKSSDEYLPSVMTCTNYLKLPEYSTLEVTRRQILTAIHEGQNAFLLS